MSRVTKPPARPERGRAASLLALALAARLVGLYPRAWRARYGAELLAWVAERAGERRLGPLTVLDLLGGALDARLHPDLPPSEPRANTRWTLMPDPDRLAARLRGVVLGVLCGYAAFVFAGAGYQKLTEYDDFVAAAHRHAAVGAAFDTVAGASLVALAAMLAAGVPIGLAAVRQALAGRRELVAPLGVVALGVLWFAGTLALLAWRAHVVPAGRMESWTHLGLWIVSFALAAATGVAGAVAAVRRTQLSARLLRFAAGAAVVSTAAMAVMLAATVTWGLALRAADPALFHGAEGIRATSTAGTWATIVAVMAAATVAAALACTRGFTQQRPTGREPSPAAPA